MVESDGLLTKKGKLINYHEAHAMGVGYVDGRRNPDADHLERLDKAREQYEDVDNEPHYFTKGFYWAQKLPTY